MFKALRRATNAATEEIQCDPIRYDPPPTPDVETNAKSPDLAPRNSLLSRFTVNAEIHGYQVGRMIDLLFSVR